MLQKDAKLTDLHNFLIPVLKLFTENSLVYSKNLSSKIYIIF